MEDQPRRLVVVPAWNEEEIVGQTIRSIKEHCPSLDVLVVADGCTDNTVSIARDAGATVLVLPFNLGVGGAMRTGFLYARRAGYTQVIQVDADGQHPHDMIEPLFDRLEHANVVVGARFAGVGDYKVRGPRNWAMKFLSFVVSKLARTKLTDITSGFRASDAQAIDLFATHYPAEYLGDTIDSLVMSIRGGLKVEQVPVAMLSRQGGQASTSPIKAMIYLARALLALFVAVTRRRVYAGRS